MLKRIIYLSSQAYPLQSEELMELQAQCRINNLYYGLTGLLVYKDGSFCQVLEGAEEALVSVFKRIAKDRRHKNVLILDQRTVSKRLFKRWSMAFENLDAIQGQAMTLTELEDYLLQKFKLSEKNEVVPHMLSAFVMPNTATPDLMAS